MDFDIKNLLFTVLLLTIYLMLDTNKSGTIDSTDFDKKISNIATEQKWGTDDPRYFLLSAVSMLAWSSIQKQGDKNADGKLTVHEWLDMWKTVTTKSLETEAPMAVQSSEFKEFYTVFKKKADRNEGALTIEQVQELWVEYNSKKPEDSKDPQKQKSITSS